MDKPKQVLDFWLGEVGPDGWYAGGADLDALCRDRGLGLWQQALAGGLTHWRKSPKGALAYVILTDQLPRNMHRGSAQAFATDALARAAARDALAQGFDLEISGPERQFFYMPLEHSEDAADQALSVQLMQERMAGDPDMGLHARAHAEVIRRFGRFPFRNAALGRPNSDAEARFLAEGGYGAVVGALRNSHAPGA